MLPKSTAAVIVVCMLAIVIAVVVFAAGGNPAKSNSTTTSTVTKTHHKVAPQLFFLGVNSCNVTTHASFQLVMIGFTPNNQAQLVVQYPDGSTHVYEVGSPGLPAGTVQLNGKGAYTSNFFECWAGSHASTGSYPAGTYRVYAVDHASGQMTKKLSFTVTAPTG